MGEGDGSAGGQHARAQPAHRHGGVAVTLAAAAVLASALGARAAIALGSGGEELQSAVRTEVKSGAAIVEDVRFVYQDEAPVAYRVARSQVLAQELRRAASRQTGIARAETLVDAQAQTEVSQALRRASSIAKNPRYRSSDGGFDVGHRLADV